MTSSNVVEDNFTKVRFLVEEAKDLGAVVVALPECFAFLGARDGEVREVAEPLSGPLFSRYQALAQKYQIDISYGGFAEHVPGQEKCANAHVWVSSTGAIQAVYRKVHLFDINLPGGPRLMESDGYVAGTALKSVEVLGQTFGLSICYDLRFPRLFQRLRDDGAEVLMIPAAFTMTTGAAHWEVLQRARAIENQCYVVCAAQRGKHNERRQSFGHAMIVDPWGTVIAQCPERTSVVCTKLDFEAQARTRESMPLMKHERRDLF